MTENRIEGTGQTGCFIGPYGKQPARDNKLVGNIFRPFKAAVADVMFDKATENNEVIGEGGTVSDEGTNNKITGLNLLSK